MLACRFYIMVTLVFMAYIPMVSAQSSTPINEDFKNVAFPEFKQKVETLTGYRLFFKPEELDSFRVNIAAENIRLPELLTKIFANTSFRFSIDTEKNVFIQSKISIQTSLPKDFFNITIVDNDSLDAEGFFPEPQEARKELSSLQNKIYEIGNKQSSVKKDRATIAGYIRNSKTGESFTGAMVFTDTPYIAVVTDQFGYYTISLPTGRHILQVNSLGMKAARRQVILYSDGKLNVDLETLYPVLKM